MLSYCIDEIYNSRPDGMEAALHMSASLRKAVRDLKNNYNFGRWAGAAFAESLGKAGLDDQRSARICATWIEGLRAVLRLVTLNEKGQFSIRPQFFTPDGYRYIRRHELAFMGTGRACKQPFTLKQVDGFVNALDAARFIDRGHKRDVATKHLELYIRVRADRIIDAIKKAMERRKLNFVLSVPPHDKQPKIKRKNVLKKLANNTGPVHLHVEVFYNKVDKQIAHHITPAIHGQSSPKQIMSEIQQIKNNPAPAGEISLMENQLAQHDLPQLDPLTIGDESFREITALIQTNFRYEYPGLRLTIADVSAIKRYVCSGLGRHRMTLEKIKAYFNYRGAAQCYQPSEWQATCNLEFFLKAWPAILLKVEQEQVQSIPEVSSVKTALEQFKPGMADIEVRDDILATEQQIAAHPSPYVCSDIGSLFRLFLTHMAFGRTNAAHPIFQEYRYKFWLHLMNNPLYALAIQRCFPDACVALEMTSWHWSQIRENYYKILERQLSLKSLADSYDVPTN